MLRSKNPSFIDDDEDSSSSYSLLIVLFCFTHKFTQTIYEQELKIANAYNPIPFALYSKLLFDVWCSIFFSKLKFIMIVLIFWKPTEKHKHLMHTDRTAQIKSWNTSFQKKQHFLKIKNIRKKTRIIVIGMIKSRTGRYSSTAFSTFS